MNYDVNWTFTARRLLDLDLTVDRLEVTQAIQDKANSIPLVQGRSTVVRAFLGVGKNQAPYPLVTGRLNGYSGNTELGSVKPFNPGGRITALPQPDWKQIDHTLNFELPIAWTEQPSLRLEVEVNDDRSLFETNYENNKLSASLTTRSCQGISIAYLPVHYTPPEGFTPTDPSDNISIGQEFMRKVYPIPDKGLKYFPRPGLTWPKSVSTLAGANELVDALTQRLLPSSGSGSIHVYGWTPTLATPSNGLGDQPGQGAFGNDTESPNRWRRTFAHEVGHNFGLGHSTTAGTDGRHWFDVYERKIKPAGGDLYDIMVPAKNESEAWISPSSYLFLMSKMCGAGAVPIEQSKPETPAVIDNLIVAGTLNNGPTITGTLGPLYRTTTAPTFVLPADTTYCVKLKNAADTNEPRQASMACCSAERAALSGRVAEAIEVSEPCYFVVLLAI